MSSKRIVSAIALAAAVAASTPAQAFFGWFKSDTARQAAESAQDLSAGKKLAGSLKNLSEDERQALCAHVLRKEAVELALYAGKAGNFGDWVQARDMAVLTLRSAMLLGNSGERPPAQVIAAWEQLGEGSGDWWFVQESALSLCRALAQRQILSVQEHDQLMQHAQAYFLAIEGAERLFKLKRPDNGASSSLPSEAPEVSSHFSNSALGVEMHPEHIAPKE